MNRTLADALTLPDVEVIELLAMLDGEPRCEIGVTVDPHAGVLGDGHCQNDARWITKLHCGHPFAICNEHLADASGDDGVIVCDCGKITAWCSRAPFMLTIMGLLATTGPRVTWLPL